MRPLLRPFTTTTMMAATTTRPNTNMCHNTMQDTMDTTLAPMRHTIKVWNEQHLLLSALNPFS